MAHCQQLGRLPVVLVLVACLMLAVAGAPDKMTKQQTAQKADKDQKAGAAEFFLLPLLASHLAPAIMAVHGKGVDVKTPAPTLATTATTLSVQTKPAPAPASKPAAIPQPQAPKPITTVVAPAPTTATALPAPKPAVVAPTPTPRVVTPLPAPVPTPAAVSSQAAASPAPSPAAEEEEPPEVTEPTEEEAVQVVPAASPAASPLAVMPSRSPAATVAASTSPAAAVTVAAPPSPSPAATATVARPSPAAASPSPSPAVETEEEAYEEEASPSPSPAAATVAAPSPSPAATATVARPSSAVAAAATAAASPSPSPAAGTEDEPPEEYEEEASPSPSPAAATVAAPLPSPAATATVAAPSPSPAATATVAAPSPSPAATATVAAPSPSPAATATGARPSPSPAATGASPSPSPAATATLAERSRSPSPAPGGAAAAPGEEETDVEAAAEGEATAAAAGEGEAAEGEAAEGEAGVEVDVTEEGDTEEEPEQPAAKAGVSPSPSPRPSPAATAVAPTVSPATAKVAAIQPAAAVKAAVVTASRASPVPAAVAAATRVRMVSGAADDGLQPSFSGAVTPSSTRDAAGIKAVGGTLSTTVSTDASAPFIFNQPGATKTILIGCLAPAEGNQASVGAAVRAALQMALVDTAPTVLGPGVNVNLTCIDTKCADIPAYTATTRLAEEGAVGIVGDICSGASVAAAGVANQKKLPLISPSSTAASLSLVDLFFRTVPSDRYQGVAAANLIFKQGGRNVGLVYEDNTYGYSLAYNFIAGFTSIGGNVPVVYEFEPSQGSPAAAVAKMLAGVTSPAKPEYKLDSVFISTTDVAFVADLLVEAKKSGLDLKFYGGDALADPTLFAKVAGRPSALPDLVATTVNPGTDAFISKFERFTNGQQYQAFAAHAYDAMVALLKAYAAAAVKQGPAIAAELQKQQFEGVSGEIAFDNFGDLQSGDKAYVWTQFDAAGKPVPKGFVSKKK